MSEQPDLGDVLRDLLGDMERNELDDLARELGVVARAYNMDGPQDAEELWTWIHDNLGLQMPRVAVCEGHDAPYDFVKEAYFEEVMAAVVIANRGGMKTLGVAILHLLKAKFKAKYEGISVGAIEQQALRAYAHLQDFLCIDGQVDEPEDHPDVKRSIMRETVFNNKAKIEVVPGTPANVNGPHPNGVHADEYELMDPEVAKEMKNMSASKNGIAAQDWITSTRKYARGAMQALVERIKKAEEEGYEPPYKLYQWCIFETAAQVPNCRVANPEMVEQGCACECDRVRGGSWEDGKPRTLDQVCQGRLFRSRGFITYQDIKKRFMENDRFTWEAQQECVRPSAEGLILQNFARYRHGIRWWHPDPMLGPIYMSVDFGGGNKPHAVNWYQVLTQPTEAHGMHDQHGKPSKVLQPGTRVCFDEVYRAEIGDTELADLALARELAWKNLVPGWTVTERFCDWRNKSQRLNFAYQHGQQFISYIITHEIVEHIKMCKVAVDGNLLAVDLDRCEVWCDEAESWRRPKKRAEFIEEPEGEVNDFNHCMSNFRYLEANLNGKMLSGGHGQTDYQELPATSNHRANTDMLPASRGDGLRSERWRDRFVGIGVMR